MAKPEELLEFIDILGPHSGENLAEFVLRMLEELDVAPKLLTITGDNVANNGTLCDSLHAELLKKYDDKNKPISHQTSYAIPWTAKIYSLSCPCHQYHLQGRTGFPEGRLSSRGKDYTGLTGHAKQPSIYLCSKHKKSNMKIRLQILWIARSLQRHQSWKEKSPGKQVGYDIDNRWNSTYIMIADALRLQKELGQFVRTHPEVDAPQLTDNEWSILEQVAKVLQPFWDYTNSVSNSCPTIAQSFPIYWSLDGLLDDVQKAQGGFEDVDTKIRDGMERGIQKMNKFARKLDTNLLYCVASVLDPRMKSSLIGSQMSAQVTGLIITQWTAR
ncbi:hypothetical protein MYU51_000747 [Penicillium brevicompactum]